jgi:hypothetical protein
MAMTEQIDKSNEGTDYWTNKKWNDERVTGQANSRKRMNSRERRKEESGQKDEELMDSVMSLNRVGSHA